MLPEIGELVFSFVIGYMGALEFLYVVRHLYHWGFRHNPEMRDYKTEAESLRKLQEQLKIAIAEAKEREEMGMKAMKDGVVYKDGFRIDEDKKKIEELKEKIRIQEQVLERQREIEEELERQRKIEEETRQQLKKAEEELRRMEEEKKREKQKAEEEKRKAEEKKRKAEEEAKRKLEEEKRKAEEAELKRKQAEEEENNRKILEAERKREEEQRRQEEEIENQKKLLQAEKEREEKQRQLEIEAEKARIEEEQRKILQAEKEREEKQWQQELEAEEARKEQERRENEEKLLQAEREREEKQRLLEIEAETKRQEEEQLQKLLQAEREREEQQRLQEIEDERIVQKLLEAERAREAAELESQAAEERENAAKLIAAEQEALRKQREEEENEENVRSLLEAERELELKQLEMEEEAANLQRLIEAEREMEERQRQLDLEALEKLKHAQEETELKASAVEEEAFIKKEISQADQSVPQSIKTQFGQSVSESLKPKTILFPGVSEESTSADPFSSKQSSFSTQLSSDAAPTDLHFDEYERQAPDGGEDMPSLQYSDDYLRSLDGIKNKPLVREDGSGRRRAFKKRRSSGSSTSSRDSRASREEELKMFTSLEEEEFENIRKGESEYDAIKYASEPTLKVHNKRRHKRSPAKDGSEKGSLEMLDEEESNPWGEVKPENYKNTEFWKREKNLSIDEEQEEYDAQQRIQSPNPAVRNLPKMSSFEEATKSQHEEAISALKRQRSKDPEPIEEPDEEQSEITNLIFSGEYTKAMNKDWHSGHFCCWQCDESLTGQRYVIRDDHPYCIKCYENVFANTCEECSKIIGIDSKDLSYKDKHWHEACFLCNKCRISLVDKQFGAKADKIYCGNCYDAQFASRCDGCGEVFRAGTKKMEYKTRQWHEKCFCCCVCKTPIGTKSFIPREQEIYCAGCYEEKFATRCIKCNKVITAGGVTYKNEPWHRECFTCTNCDITLAGQRFTSRDEKPYCANCFGELFAKRCTSCVKPITGIGGTRFISFEERHWHHDCFICASCKTSLVGRGFITDGPDIICPECAKQKLI